ncbi:bifunctional DNA primase/polymerase [Streptomyces cocklensis]|nr:bifunctional DNA primase/polymerase [Actinacidiphila cocklensis]MDD1060098.1 bifunctional DNA primase/polymerase [Actinacidiphila cocklensis]WSX81871.1 bifunctional DNA primase/polymerase [Streptomyces sp. NBC_00899]
MRAGVRRRTHAGVCTTVGDYAGRCGWAVVPGARVSRGGGPCSCGNADCREPGAHPLPFADEIPAGASPASAAEAWARVPGAAVLLPAGRSFDVIEVAEGPGRRALVRLERMGLRLGPVLLTPAGRAQFFVAPGAAAELPHLLYRMGWDDAELDLRCLGPGDHVTAPPSDLGGRGPVRWLREPLPGGAPQPPEARLLLGTLAFVCHRDRAAYA